MEAFNRLESGPLVVLQHLGALFFIRARLSLSLQGSPRFRRTALFSKQKSSSNTTIEKQTASVGHRDYSSWSFWHSNLQLLKFKALTRIPQESTDNAALKTKGLTKAQKKK